MLDVFITYHSGSRLMEITALSSRYDPNITSPLPKDKPVATTGDDKMTTLNFAFDDPAGLLAGYTARVEFGVDVIGPESSTYRPFIVLGDIVEDEVVPNRGPIVNPFAGTQYTAVLTQSILSSVKCGILPIQLAFSKESPRDEKTEFYSLNILNLAINKALDAVQDANVERDPKFGDAVYDVEYDRNTSTFFFRQVDGSHIDITLSDSSEEHYEVDTYNDLITLDMAEPGDTATALDTGVWYKLYGTYDTLSDWYDMPGGATLNGEPTTAPAFYAPIQSGASRQMLITKGAGQSPEWRTMARSFYVNFANQDTFNIQLYSAYQGSITKWIDTDGSNIHCVFYDSTTFENVDLPYQLIQDNGSTPDNPLYSITVTNKIRNGIKMDVYAIPSLGGVY